MDRKRWVHRIIFLITIIVLLTITGDVTAQWRDTLRSIVVYGEGTVATPRYRLWDNATSTWGTEASATTATATIQYVVLKRNPTTLRNEAVLGTQSSTGAIQVQIWNGTTWSAVTSLGAVGTTCTAPNTCDDYRGFDIAYENLSGDAIVVFADTATGDPRYVVWNGTSWSGETTITTPVTTAGVRWIKLASKPRSDEIAMIMIDGDDDVYGMVWNGSSWFDMGVTADWDESAASSTRECIAVEYEQLSGKAMFLWGDSVATDNYWRTWHGGTLSSATLLDIPAQGGVTNWISLKADPLSNWLLAGFQDAGADLNTRAWNGSSWDSATEHPEHSAATENVASRNFDIEYEIRPGAQGQAIFIYGDGATATWKFWTPTVGATGWSAGRVIPSSDDTATVQLRRDCNGVIHAALYDDPSSARLVELTAGRWDGGWTLTFTATLALDTTPSTTAQPVMEPFMIAPDAGSICPW